jgi:hypothetical protein
MTIIAKPIHHFFQTTISQGSFSEIQMQKQTNKTTHTFWVTFKIYIKIDSPEAKSNLSY